MKFQIYWPEQNNVLYKSKKSGVYRKFIFYGGTIIGAILHIYFLAYISTKLSCFSSSYLGMGIKSKTQNQNRIRTEKSDPLSDPKYKNIRTDLVEWYKKIWIQSIINQTRTDNPKNSKLIININIWNIYKYFNY